VPDGAGVIVDLAKRRAERDAVKRAGKALVMSDALERASAARDEFAIFVRNHAHEITLDDYALSELFLADLSDDTQRDAVEEWAELLTKSFAVLEAKPRTRACAHVANELCGSLLAAIDEVIEIADRENAFDESYDDAT
jgi:hypothetical protein